MNALSTIIPKENQTFLIIGDDTQMVVTKKAEPKKAEPKKMDATKPAAKPVVKSVPKSKK
jgi:hypothetical protein